jgi:hypothetical protein
MERRIAPAKQAQRQHVSVAVSSKIHKSSPPMTNRSIYGAWIVWE